MSIFCFCSSPLDGEGPITVTASGNLNISRLTVQMPYDIFFNTPAKFGTSVKSIGLTQLIASAAIPRQEYNIIHSVPVTLSFDSSLPDNFLCTKVVKSVCKTSSTLIARADKISGDIFDDFT